MQYRFSVNFGTLSKYIFGIKLPLTFYVRPFLHFLFGFILNAFIYLLDLVLYYILTLLDTQIYAC